MCLTASSMLAPHLRSNLFQSGVLFRIPRRYFGSRLLCLLGLLLKGQGRGAYAVSRCRLRWALRSTIGRGSMLEYMTFFTSIPVSDLGATTSVPSLLPEYRHYHHCDSPHLLLLLFLPRLLVLRLRLLATNCYYYCYCYDDDYYYCYYCSPAPAPAPTPTSAAAATIAFIL